MFSLHRLAESLRAEFRNCDLTGAECGGREHAGKVRDVKDGSRVQVCPTFGVSPLLIGRGSLSITCCQLNCTSGTAREEWRTIPCGCASSSTPSISLVDRRVFSGTAITPSMLQAYMSSM